MDKVGAKMLDLFRGYWATMERLEVRWRQFKGSGVWVGERGAACSGGLCCEWQR